MNLALDHRPFAENAVTNCRMRNAKRGLFELKNLLIRLDVRYIQLDFSPKYHLHLSFVIYHTKYHWLFIIELDMAMPNYLAFSIYIIWLGFKDGK